MKFTSLLLSCVLAVTALSAAQQFSDATSVPRLINFAGTLPPAAVGAHPEAVGATFLIYGEQQGGEALWMETQTVHPDALGHYTITLGAATSQGVPAYLFTTGEPRWLSIQIPGETEAARIRLVSVPYALKSGDAETLGGLPLSAFVLAKDNKTAAAESAPEASAALQVKPAATTTPAGTVTSVSLSAPTSDFTVSGNPVTKSGTLAFKWTVPPTSQSIPNSIVKRDSVGSIKTANVIAGYGYFNVVSTDSIYTRLISSQDISTYGDITAGNSLVVGNTTSKGLRLRDNGTGVDLESIGVPLYVNYLTQQKLSLGQNGGSVYVGYDPNSGHGASLFVGNGNGSFSTSAYFTNLVEMAGDLDVFGNLQVTGTKDFSIDHPLDPLNKTLDHAAIESSEVLNQYSGNATLNANGEATVTFPDWFSSINTDFRYQLTAVGAPGPGLYIAKEVAGGSFTIAGGQPGSKVSWQVTAKRNDAYMQAHPFQAERQKPEALRGRYTLPELYAPRKDSAIAKLSANAN